MPASLIELLGELRSTFERLGVRWYLFGAQAAILHGSPRLTADVDVTIDLAEHAATDVIEALERAGFRARVVDPLAFVERTRVLPSSTRRLESQSTSSWPVRASNKCSFNAAVSNGSKGWAFPWRAPKMSSS